MPAKFQGDLIRTYINLHAEDKDILEAKYGHGWSGVVRDVIHEHCQKLKPKKPIKLEDLHGDFT